MAALHFWLDDYNDIFSDFDSRQYSRRRVSEDFVQELRSAFALREEAISELVLLLPGSRRKSEQEHLIAESLQNYFLQRREAHNKFISKKRRSAYILLLVGFLLMTIDALFVYKIQNETLSRVLRIIMEPAGWFFVWTGMESFFYDLKRLKTETRFYNTISSLNWHFKSIEE